MNAPSACPHILVVDDEPQVLSAIEDLLEDEYVVDTTNSLERALEHIQRGDLAVILSDQRMPEFSGDQLLTRANELCDASRVLVTGYADLDAVTRAVNNGKIFAYIAKPWDPATFRATVRQAVEYHELLRAVERERGLLHALMDNTPDAVYFKDAEGRYIRANAPVAATLGVSDVRAIIGRRTREFVNGEYLAAIEAEDEQVLSSGTPVVSERLIARHGERRWYSVSKAPIRYGDTKSEGLVGIARNISDRKRAEEAVEMVNRIAVMIGERADVESATRIAIEEICGHYGWVHGETWLPRASDPVLELGSVHLDGDPRTGVFVEESARSTFRRGEGLLGRCWASGEYEWITDLSKLDLEVVITPQLLIQAGFKAVCGIPVFAGKTLSAVLAFFMREIHEEDAQRAEAIAACLAPLGYFLERIKTETALRETDERLNLALSSARVGTWTYDFAGRLMHVDEHMAVLLGLAPESFSEPIGQFEKRIHAEDRAFFGEAIDASLLHASEDDEGGEFEVEFRVPGANHSTQVLSARGKLHRQAHGAVSLMGAANDVTEIRSLADFSAENPFPVFRVRADGVLLEANPAAVALLDVQGGRFPSGVRPEWREIVGRLLVEGRREVVEELSVDEKVFRLTFVPIAEKRYVNVYGEDITQQRESEATLRQVQKMRAVGELTGGIAHDFNNRLTVILGNLELLERRLGDNELAHQLLAAARDGAEGGAKLTRQLLAFSRSQVLETETLDLNGVVGGIRELITRTIGRTFRVRLALAEALWLVTVDRNQLEDVLINLSVNARDAMPSGGELRIETANHHFTDEDIASRPYMSPGDYVALSVADTGTGMPAEVRERIFEPFFTTKEKGKGTGLGLAMVYGYVKQSGGHVEVESEEGRGTRFHIYLPRANPSEPCGEPHKAPTAAERRPARILVAEDDPGVRLVAVTLLRDMGYEVVEVEDGPAALRALEADSGIDLLFTDMVMPGGLTGLELGKATRERRPDLPVVYASGYTDEGPFAEDNAGREIHWVGKPYDGATLERKIAEALCGGG